MTSNRFKKHEIALFILLSGIGTLTTEAFSGSIPSKAFMSSVKSPSMNKVVIRSKAVEDADQQVPSDMGEDLVDEITNANLPSEAIFRARDNVISLAKSLSEESLTGVFLTSPDAKSQLLDAITKLEAVAPTTLMGPPSRKLIVGDWELVCTTNGPIRPNMKSKKSLKLFKKSKLSLPFSLPKFPDISNIQDSMRKSISVLQRIRVSPSSTDDDVDRIDNVIEYTPLSLKDLVPEDSPLSAVRELNVNPLEVSRSKVTLVHDAKIESLSPVFRTNINLKSVVVTVAGTSQYLEPEGADILGLNIPSLGDFMNSGSFDTTYVDENIRISRGTIGFLNELRVFVRKDVSVGDILEGTSTTSDDEPKDNMEEDATDDVTAKIEEADTDEINATSEIVEESVKTEDGNDDEVKESQEDEALESEEDATENQDPDETEEESVETEEESDETEEESDET